MKRAYSINSNLNANILILSVMTILLVTSCKGGGATQDEQTTLVSVKTAPIEKGDIVSNVSFNGKTVYLKKNLIISPIAGYIVLINAKFGDQVKKNEVLFEIQTKENKALENTDSFKGKIGIIEVNASSSGSISEMNVNETGNYVVEGGSLCSIIDNGDLMVQINVPFLFNSKLRVGTKCRMQLTDDSYLNGVIYKILPTINEDNQTQNVLIKPFTNRQLPENLNLTVQFLNAKHTNACLVPIEAVMSNETLSEFWVMKIVNNNIAVKVPVVKGIENEKLVEILSPVFNNDDFIITEGAYGLEDSTVVKIVK